MGAWEGAAARALDVDPVEAADEADASPKAPRRNRKAHALEINWGLAQQLYVYGEFDSTSGERRWPSLRAIGERCGCNGVSVYKRADKSGWKKLRKQQVRAHEVQEEKRAAARKAPPKLPTSTQAKPSEVADMQTMLDAVAKAAAAGPNPGAPPTDDPLAVVTAFLKLFGDAVAEQRALPFSVGDYDKAVRLRTFLLNDMASRAERREAVSLEQLQAKHGAMRAMELGVTDETAGVLSHGEAEPDPVIAATTQKRQSRPKDAPESPDILPGWDAL